MITAFVVISSIVLAIAFSLAWLINPRVRRQVEKPKYAFQAQIRRYNRAAGAGQRSNSEDRDEQ